MATISAFFESSQLDEQVASCSSAALPVECYGDILHKIIKIKFNGVLWMLANPFADVLGYADCPDAIRENVSPENQVQYDVIKSTSRCEDRRACGVFTTSRCNDRCTYTT